MKKISLIVGALVVFGLFVFLAAGQINKNDDNSLTGAIVSNSQVQEVKLSFVNYEYKLEPSTFTQGVPVRMVADMDTIYGCMRDVRIPAFGVSKYVSEGDNIIEFTPTKSGRFNIMCSMNMGRGSFSVVESDGSSADYVETVPIAAAGSCASGGCGCGSRN